MSSSRLLDFFVLEATDYIDRLDSLLSDAGDGGPDIESLTAQARLLRGSATMARQLPLADLSSALERIGRALRDGVVQWTPELNAALVAAVDDLKILIRAVRSWGAGDDRRTESRISELVSLYPQATKTRPTPPTNPRNSSFIASESAQLASALDSLVAHPSAPEGLAMAVHRLSSLRGVAAINDTPPLPQVLAALDDILRPLHTRGATPETAHLAVLTSGVQLLRRFSQEIAIGGTLDPAAPVVNEFNAALGGLSRPDMSAVDSVIPISRLNFEDGMPQLVTATAQPPRTPAQRFRMEAAGPCEHLRHQVALARAANDELSRRRIAEETRASLRVLRSIAEGFEDAEIVGFVDAVRPEAAEMNARSLTLLDELAKALMDESNERHVAHARLRALLNATGDDRLPSRSPAAVAAPESPAPAAAPQRPTPPFAAAPTYAGSNDPTPLYTPAQSATIASAHPPPAAAPAPPRKQPTPPVAGAELSALLSAGISGLSELEKKPLSKPVHIIEEDVVPISELLYKGREAITRAQEIRDNIRARAGAPHSEELDELFELLDLAATE